MLDMIKKHLEDLAAGDWKAYREGLADDAIYDEVPTGQRVQGAEAFVASVQRWKKAFPDLRATVIDSVISGDKAALEVEWEGTQRGPLEAPFGNIPATNKQGRTRAVMNMRFANGKLVESRHYFDLYSLMMQLGLAPRLATQPAAKPAQAAKQT